VADGGGWIASAYKSLVKSESRPSPGRSLVRDTAVGSMAKGYLLDPMAMQNSSGGFYQRMPMSYEALRIIGTNAPLISAIVGTRISQIQSFARRPKHDFDIGLRVRMRDPNAKMTRAARAECEYITNFIMQCGVPGRDRAVMGDNFRQFTAKVIRDSLFFDQANWQVRFDKGGKPYEMIAMPAMQMRIKQLQKETDSVIESDATIDPIDPDDMRYVQIYQERKIAEFSRREMAWMVRNPTSDTDHFGYGVSEIETMIPLILSLAWAEEYNTRFFSQGASIKGLINIKGDISTRQLEQFRNEWHALVTGVSNAWRTPVLASKEGVDWLSMHANNREMEFSEWINYRIKQICGKFQIAPEEVNFQYGNIGQGKAMFENSAESKLKWSRDRGLRPLLTGYEDELNSSVVQQINADCVAEFVGLDIEDEKDRLGMIKDYVSTVLTVDECRKMLGRTPLPNGTGKIILNQIWMSAQKPAGEPAEGADFSASDFSSDDDAGDDEPDEADGESDKPDEDGEEKPADKDTAEVQKSRSKVVRITTIEVQP
jgi:HK97 family phage portal protein